MNKTFIILLIVLFLIIGVIGFWYWQNNIYSKEVLKLEILGPNSVQTGELFDYLVKFKNNGKVRLEAPELIFEAPEQSALEDYDSLRVTQTIDDIYPGEERTYTFRARLLAKQGTNLEAKAWLSYLPKNLSARFESKTSFTNTVDFVPLTFEFDLSPRIEGNEEIIFSLNYFSNVDYLMEDLRIKIEYPSGFAFIDSSPGALDDNEWTIYSLYKASGGKIEIKGELNGKEGEEKVFKAQLGMLINGEFWLLKETSQSVKIVESSLHISSLVNNVQNYRASAGDLLHYEVFFKNIGNKPIQKKFLIAKLDGHLFDLSSLKSDSGEFAPGDDTVLWDWKNVSDLRFLDVGDEGKVELWVRLKQDIDQHLRDPKVNVIVSLGGVERIFETKVNSQIRVIQKAYYSEQEFFLNQGPQPPEVGESTEYAVVWQVENSWSDLENVRVKSKLAKGVAPTGKIFPEDAKFTYDSSSKTVMWNLGDMEAWNDMTMAFQIRFTPSASQAGRTPDLVVDTEVFATDTWTSELIEEQADDINTSVEDVSDGRVK